MDSRTCKGELRMAKYLTSKIIKSPRLALGITRKDLAEGICSEETLYHCESGQHEVTREIYEQLMQRMGRIGEKNYTFLSVGGIEAFELQEELIKELECRNISKVYLLLKELERTMPEEQWDRNDRQFFITYRARIDMEIGKITEDQCLKKLKEALNLTMKDVDKINLDEWVFNYQEQMIILNMIEVYRRIGYDKEFIELLLKMVENIKNAEMPGWEEDYVFFTTCYLKLIDEDSERCEEVLKLAEEMLLLCKKIRVSQVVPDLYDSILCCIRKLGERGERKLELEMQALKRSYYLSIAAGNYSNKAMENVWMKQYKKKDFIV